MMRRSTDRHSVRGLHRRPTTIGLRVESLESRRLLATITVNSILDSNASDAVLTLREAILVNDGTLGRALSASEAALVIGTPSVAGVSDIIKFAIGSGSQSIALTSALPSITHLAIINGTSQPGYTNVPLIEVNGNGFSGINATVATSLSGLVLNRFSSSAVTFTANGNSITNSYIGTNAAGTSASANGGDGISFQGSSNNTIGGTVAAAGNVISGNGFNGITLSPAGAVTSNSNLIQGNLIGLNAAGNAAIGNGSNGVSIDGGSNNTIGGTTSTARNVISGNLSTAVNVSANNGNVTGTLIAGNLIGTNAAGTVAIGNGSTAITVAAAGAFTTTNTTIGGVVGFAGNVISGSVGASSGGITLVTTGVTATLIQGNRIGTDASGQVAFPNGSAGISLITNSNATIGGTTSAARNVIAGNVGAGILFNTSNGVASSTLVQGNYIGIAADGLSALGNGNAGISLASSSNVQIGGTSAGARNVIGGNAGAGIISTFGTGGHLIQGNYIGVDSTGALGIGNTQGGIVISSSPSNTIGGPAAGAGNLISGNLADKGINVIGTTSTNTLIQGNLIGTDASGLLKVPNANGIYLESNFSTVLSNLISGNTNDGIVIVPNSGQANANTIQTNRIGVDALGVGNLGNGHFGVNIAGTTTTGSNNTIGGTALGVGNTIAFNGLGGVNVSTANSSNGILGNSIFQNNGNLGIDIGTAGPSNPVAVLNTVIIGNSQTFVRGTFNGVGTTTYRFEFFSTPNNGTGQGKVFLGFVPRAAVGGVVDFSTAGNQMVLSSAATLGDFITATVTDPNNNTTEFSLPRLVTAVSTFNIGVTGSPDPTLLGNNVSYFVTLVNNGPSPATNVVLTNLAPSGSVVVSASSSSGTVNTIGLTSTVTIPRIGANSTVTIVVLVTPGLTGTNADSASVTYGASTSSGSGSVQIISAADLSLTATAAPLSGNNLGSHIVYTAIVTNSGPSTSLDARLTDILPAALQFSTGTITQGGVPIGAFSISGQTITALLGDIAPGSGQITVSIDALIVATGNGISNTMSVASFGGTTDPNTTNNSQKITRNFTRSADVSVTSITASGPLLPNPPFDGTPLINQNLTFTINVVNNGPSPAQNAAVDVALPALFGYVYVSGSTTATGGSVAVGGSGVLAFLGDLTSGQVETITVVLRPTATGLFDVTATATTTTSDPDSSNNSAFISVDVQPVTNLSAVVIAQPSPVVAGDILTYTVIVTNNGPSVAMNATVTDTLPISVTNIIVSPSQGTYTLAGNLATVNFGKILVGGQAVVQFFVTPSTSGKIVNQVVVSNAGVHNLTGITNVTTNVDVTPAADLAVTTVATLNPAPIGQPLEFVVTVKNNGPSPATNVALTNVLPITGYTGSPVLVTSQGIFSLVGTTATVLFGTINPQATATLTIRLTPNVIGSLTNSAHVTSDAADRVPSNDTSTLVVPVSPAADLVLTAAPVPSNVIRGSTITYVLTITNNGPSTAENVQLTNILPPGAVFASATTSQGTAALSGGSVIATIGSLVIGQTATVTIAVIPTLAGTYTNTATVSSTTIDYSSGSNSVSQTTTVSGVAGSLQFSSPTYSVGENGGSVTVTVLRVGGSAGQVTVNYATGGGTAIANINYVPVSGTLLFNDGETSKTIVVPVLNDMTPDSGTIVGIQLGSPGLGGSLGTITSATIAITDTNGNLIPGPKIISVQRAGTGSTLQVVVTFDSAMDPTTAQNLANYKITTFGKPPRRGAPAPVINVPIKSAFYDTATRTVTLTTSGKVNINGAFTLTIVGTPPSGVSSSKGVLIDGTNSGFNGTNYVTSLDAIDPRFARTWIKYLESRLPRPVRALLNRHR